MSELYHGEFGKGCDFSITSCVNPNNRVVELAAHFSWGNFGRNEWLPTELDEEPDGAVELDAHRITMSEKGIAQIFSIQSGEKEVGKLLCILPVGDDYPDPLIIFIPS